MSIDGKHILVGISGGIAAYKIPELIRLLRKEGAEVKVTTTANALQFVTELTLQTLSGHKVYSDVFAAINEHSTEHISLPDWADVMLIAPATANVLGKMAHGIADDALTTTFCAMRKPVVFAPAMNSNMYQSPAVQEAIRTLAGWDNVLMLDCAEGALACGTTGKGRMQEIDVLAEAVHTALTPQSLSGKHVLLTAGPTQEQLDSVRYISNYSSGKMGYALARECLHRGAEVTLVSGPTCQKLLAPFPDKLHLVEVRSAEEMYCACTKAFPAADIAILCAAVADFKPGNTAAHKIKKQPGQSELQLNLTLTPDIAAALGRSKSTGQTIVGFALETDNEETNARHKMLSKGMDMIVLNSLQDAGAGFGCDTNKVTILKADGGHYISPLLPKQQIADIIIEQL
ncbi:MAG: bifunctional phosphopantothenoylcysteine decarboxylase/phosphopantothenate--cysteine ligase CoaBC [Paludibacteraceae bacterium]